MKELRIDQIQDRLLTLIVCCNLSPEEMRERKAEVMSKLPPCGTSMGWEIVIDDTQFPKIAKQVPIAPVPCDTIEGNWHYVVMC